MRYGRLIRNYNNARGGRASGGGGFSPGTPLFFDNFNYTVTNSYSNAAANRAAFLAAGWSSVRSDNVWPAYSDGSGAETPHGDLFTLDVSAIPGFSGSAPGSNSRALCLQSKAGTDAAQTDFFLGYGSTIGDVPANVYFQFWLRVARDGSHPSQFHFREKFIYPTRNTYPATEGNNGGHWLFELCGDSSEPSYVAVSNPGEAFGLSRDDTIVSDRPYISTSFAIANGSTNHLGQNISTAKMFNPNEWVEIRIHYDTSGASGVYELWRRTVGQPWTKLSEWIDGVTANFAWAITAPFRDGHAGFIMPSTMPGANTTPLYDAWMYMQDFAIATSAASLPKYEGY